jgi:hypothetical protein
MGDNKQVPEVRFKCFGDVWKEKHLGNLGKAKSGIGFPEIFQGGKSGVPFYKVSDMNNHGNEYEMKNANNHVSDTQISLNNWTVFDDSPAVIFAKVGAAIMLNRKRLVENIFLIDNNLMAYIFGDEWDVSFGKVLFDRTDLTSLAQIGALPSYNASDIENYKVTIPADLEQTKIGELFKNLDTLINQHQTRVAQLANVKKSMLDKMFPKAGADVPEVRFGELANSWSESTLGEAMNITSASRVHKGEWTNYGVPFFRTSDVVAEFKKLENKKAFISYNLYQELSAISGSVQKDDILITGGGSIGVPYLIKDNAPLYFKDADLLWLKNTGCLHGFFLYAFFTTPIFSAYVKRITHIGTISHYTIEQAKSTPIKTPSMEEQQKIGQFFQNLDTLIAQNQKALDQLKNLKQAFLNKMFV